MQCLQDAFTQSLSHSVTQSLFTFIFWSHRRVTLSTPLLQHTLVASKWRHQPLSLVWSSKPTNGNSWHWITTTLQYRTSHGHKQRMRGKTMAHETLPSLSLSQFTIATFPLALSCVKVRQHDTILQYIANIKFKKWYSKIFNLIQSLCFLFTDLCIKAIY